MLALIEEGPRITRLLASTVVQLLSEGGDVKRRTRPRKSSPLSTDLSAPNGQCPIGHFGASQVEEGSAPFVRFARRSTLTSLNVTSLAGPSSRDGDTSAWN